ncbi:helix-turn-helix transcriptional regulator [Clostridium sp.]|uniref:helix-turn-helix domain-containing protein n=1 Tax=Clostridium sp. TaxID=1506 RepID=UPI00283ED278|nr:helix-turn-helix transcriptional regulator [Clostridium sp.]MDR3597047.1 helix-turn-helix transcriptional regulator [Clostridium sp.]
MIFGEYIKNLRNEARLSQRELAEKSGVSNAEISRLETGERKKPSPIVLKSIAPFLDVTYEDLLQKAGYIEEVIDHKGFTENIYKDEDGNLIDIIRQIKDMYEKDSKWANLAYRVSASNLSETELEIIKAQTEVLLEQFLKNKNK